jgi:hypothetical protein
MGKLITNFWNSNYEIKWKRKRKENRKRKKGKKDNWATSAQSGPASLYSTHSPHARASFMVG